MDTDRRSLTDSRVAPGLSTDGLLARAVVREMLGDATTQIVKKLNARIAQAMEETLVRLLENLGNDHNLAFVRGVLNRANRVIMTSMLADGKIRDPIETAVVKMLTIVPTAHEIAKVLVNDEAIMAPMARFVIDQPYKEVREATQQPCVNALPSLQPSSRGSISSNEG